MMRVFLMMVLIRGRSFMRITLAGILLCLFSCKNTQESNEEALNGNDWFKNGVDRFYLAYINSDIRMLRNGPETYGQQFFFGVGCYGESKDPHAQVQVKKDPQSSVFVTKKLSEREMLHEFDLVVSTEKPKPGQCKILLGDENDAIQISHLKSYRGGTKAALGVVFTTTGVVCIGSIAQTAKFVGEVMAAAGASVVSKGAAAPALLPPLTLDGINTLGAIAGCGGSLKGSFEVGKNYNRDENKKLFAHAIIKAINLANNDLKNDPKKYARYVTLRRNLYNVEVAAAIWNPILVRKFNREIHGFFENGWGESQKFFDAVKLIQTDALTTSATAKE